MIDIFEWFITLRDRNSIRSSSRNVNPTNAELNAYPATTITVERSSWSGEWYFRNSEGDTLCYELDQIGEVQSVAFKDPGDSDVEIVFATTPEISRILLRLEKLGLV